MQFAAIILDAPESRQACNIKIGEFEMTDDTPKEVEVEDTQEEKF